MQGIVVASEKRETAWDGGRDRGRGHAGWRSRGSSARRDRARSTRSTGSSARRRSRTSAGASIFQQIDCEVPRNWSQLATNVVASKYFYGDVASGNGSPAEGKREYSVRQLVDRVTRTIADWGKDDGYFATAEDAERFYDELTSLCLNQYGSFNSPVWFNVGLFHRYGISGPANNWRWDEETRRVVKADERLPVSAGVGVLHPERQRRHGRDHAAGEQRGHALQVRLGDRHRPLDACARATRSSPAAASRRARSASCGSTTPSPAW